MVTSYQRNFTYNSQSKVYQILIDHVWSHIQMPSQTKGMKSQLKGKYGEVHFAFITVEEFDEFKLMYSKITLH